MFEDVWKDVMQHRGFALEFSRRYVRKGHVFDIDDLVNEGLIVLFEASRKQGLLKPAYARACLRHGLCKAIVERGRTIHVPWGSFKGNALGAKAAVSSRFWGSEYLLLLTDHVSSDTDPAPRIEQNELVERIINALDALDPRSRSVLFQLYWEGESYREIGLTLGCTRQNVSRIERRAMSHLRYAVTDTGL